MNFIPDNFISYDNDFAGKQEKMPCTDFTLDPFFNSDPNQYPASIPQTLKNFFDAGDQPDMNDIPEFNTWSKDRKKRQPFSIIKNEKEPYCPSTSEQFEVKIESEEKLLNRTKRILKREKAKQRIRIKQECNLSVASMNSKCTPDIINNPDLDEKTKKRMIQMIRNRISAQNSRDRKKAYMTQLEEMKSKLMEENFILSQEKDVLLKELRKLENEQKKLLDENEELKKNSHYRNNFECLGKDNEQESSNENFPNVFLDGLFGSKLSTNNKRNFKSTMAFATMFSIMMMLNIAQQGNLAMQDGTENLINSSISNFQKKMLEQPETIEAFEEIKEGLSHLDNWNTMQHLKPIIENFEAEYKKLGFETQSDSPTGTPTSQPNIIKMEEFESGGQTLNNNSPNLAKKIFSKFFDDEKVNIEDFIKNSEIGFAGFNKFGYCDQKSSLRRFTQDTISTEAYEGSIGERGQSELIFQGGQWIRKGSSECN